MSEEKPFYDDRDPAFSWEHTLEGMYLDSAGGEQVVVDFYDGSWISGRHYLGYTLKVNDEIIFSGEDFSPPPMSVEDDIETTMSLLDFLTLQVGDTDEEYFEDHTPAQMEWITGEVAEELRMMVMDHMYAQESA